MKTKSIAPPAERLIVEQKTGEIEKNLEALTDALLFEYIEHFYIEYREVHSRLSIPLDGGVMNGTLRDVLASAQMPVRANYGANLVSLHLKYLDKMFEHFAGRIGSTKFSRDAYHSTVDVGRLDNLLVSSMDLYGRVREYESPQWEGRNMPYEHGHRPDLPDTPGTKSPAAKLFTQYIQIVDGVPSVEKDAAKRITSVLTTYATDQQAAYYASAIDLLQKIRDLDASAGVPGLFHQITSAEGNLDCAGLLRIGTGENNRQRQAS